MSKCNYLVLGLTLGDEGKGSVVDLLGSRSSASTIVRFAADPHSAHYIVREDGDVITFGQVGSGMSNHTCRAHIGHETLLRLPSLMAELDELESKGIPILDRLTIDPETVLVLPWHVMADRMLEVSRGKSRFGTSGVGASMARRELLHHSSEAVRYKHIFCSEELVSKLEGSLSRSLQIAVQVLEKTDSPEAVMIASEYRAKYTVASVAEALSRMGEVLRCTSVGDSVAFTSRMSGGDSETLILEGTQGVLLNPRLGFRPHVSSCDSSKQNAESFLTKVGVTSQLKTVGVIRAYATRFGPGPLVTEDPAWSTLLPEMHNSASPWSGEYRAGPLDLITTRYAIRASGGVDVLAINHVDRMAQFPVVKVCTAYEYQGENHHGIGRNFHTSSFSGKEMITDIRLDCNLEEVTKLLYEMRPSRFAQFQSWSDADAESTVTHELRSFIQFLEGSEGLQTPVGILSFGPRRSDKIVMGDL